MLRTQVYLTQAEQAGLSILSQQMKIPKSELMREAIDAFLKKKLKPRKERIARLRKAAGMWADRTDLTDFESIRNELDR